MKISIITVCLNAEKTVEKTLRSVTEQTWPYIEHIVVDGQSQDRTLEIVDRYRDKLAVVISEPDHGIYDAMNKGINSASGDYLFFLNADDCLISETVIENICDILKGDNSIDILYGNVLLYDRKTGKGSMHVPKKVSLMELYRTNIPHQASFIKRDIFEKIGYYSAIYKIASDYEFILKAYKKGCVIRYEDITVSIFDRGGVSSDKNNDQLIKVERDMIKRNNLTDIERFYLMLRVRIKKIFNI